MGFLRLLILYVLKQWWKNTVKKKEISFELQVCVHEKEVCHHCSDVQPQWLPPLLVPQEGRLGETTALSPERTTQRVD